jgi:hypothetical protein
MLALTAAMLALTAVSAASPPRYFARNAHAHVTDTYAPAWEMLFLREGVDGEYPMPAAADVVDLLAPLRGTRGLAVHTNPTITVTEGMGYAMFFAGMQRDVEKLKSLVVAWQANGQAFGGQSACGGCCADGASQHHAPQDVCAGPANGLCRTVEGAFMPGWKMPMTEHACGARTRVWPFTRALTDIRILCRCSARARWARRLTPTRTRSPG